MKFLWYLLFLTLYVTAQGTDVLSYKYHVDTTNTWSVKEAYAQKENFRPITSKNESLGFRSDSVWIYVKVKNNQDIILSNLMMFSYALHDNITVYEYNNDTLIKESITGDLHRFDTRRVQTHLFTIPYQLDTNSSKEWIFKITSESSLNIGMKFYTQEEYYAQKSKDELFLGGYYGIILIMLMYNMVLYFIVKNKVYIDYVIFHLAYFFTHFSINGLAFQFFYPNFPQLNLYFFPVWFILSNYFAIKFTITYLDLDAYKYRLATYLRWLMKVFLLLLGLSFFLPYALVATTMTVMSMLTVILLLIVALYVWYKHRSTSAKVFAIAWSFLLLGAFITQLQNMGVLTLNTFTYYAAQLGALVELSLLSMSMAYGYNVVLQKLKKKESELQDLANNLEVKVQLRTEEVEVKNKQLQLQINNKNILFKELYHRVKNNLQIITSLLQLQSAKSADATSKDVLLEMTHRVKSISSIHEKLYTSDDLSGIAMQEYIHVLVDELKGGLCVEGVHFDIACENIVLDLEMSVPIGLIINELVTNAIKYAFNENSKLKTIQIKMYKQAIDTLVLEVSDNGIGADMTKIHAGFGFQLIESLAVFQLKGTIESNVKKSNNDKGLQHKITFKTGEHE